MHHLHFHLRQAFVILGIIVFLFIASFLMKTKGVDGLISLMKNYKEVGIILYFLYSTLAATVTTFPVVPIWPILFLVYGYWVSVGVTFGASLIGATLAFFLTRTYGKSFVRKVISQHFLKEVDHIVNGKSSHSFIIFRIFADNYFDIVSYAAGLSKMKYHHFIVVTGISALSWSLFNFLFISWALQFDAPGALVIMGGMYVCLTFLGILVWKFYPKGR